MRRHLAQDTTSHQGIKKEQQKGSVAPLGRDEAAFGPGHYVPSRHKKEQQKVSIAPLGRDEATRTPDPYVPNVVRYQLRYIPIWSALMS